MRRVQLLACTSMPLYLSMVVLRGWTLGLHFNLYPVRASLPSTRLCADERYGDPKSRHSPLPHAPRPADTGGSRRFCEGFERHHRMMPILSSKRGRVRGRLGY